ncbi:MAG: rhodanese-like domain-containing protein [Verrucomicrobiales bacterium]
MLRAIQQLGLIGFLWILFGGLIFWVHPQAKGLFTGAAVAVPVEEGEISLADARRFTLEGVALWIDTRPAAEYAREHVPAAHNIPADESGALDTKLFEWTRTGTLKTDTVLIIYCATSGCNTSQELRRHLLGMNSDLRVYVLAGGWSEWKRGEADAS